MKKVGIVSLILVILALLISTVVTAGGGGDKVAVYLPKKTDYIF